jgi:hypothetical protein
MQKRADNILYRKGRRLNTSAIEVQLVILAPNLAT